MEDKKFEDKILKNIKARIAVSNYKEECSMKISFRKQVLTICLVVVILLSGSFVGVNAATDGKLIESVNSFMEEMKAKLIASGTDPKLVDQMTDAYIDERTGATVFEFGEVTENEGVSIMVTETVIEE